MKMDVTKPQSSSVLRARLRKMALLRWGGSTGESAMNAAIQDGPGECGNSFRHLRRNLFEKARFYDHLRLAKLSILQLTNSQ